MISMISNCLENVRFAVERFWAKIDRKELQETANRYRHVVGCPDLLTGPKTITCHIIRLQLLCSYYAVA